MTQTEILAALDEEISRLRRVRELLAGFETGARSAGGAKLATLVASSLRAEGETEKRRPGRPKGSGNKAGAARPAKKGAGTRRMSAEGRARIAAAQRARWAKHHADAKPGGAAESGEAKATKPVKPGKAAGLKAEAAPKTSKVAAGKSRKAAGPAAKASGRKAIAAKVPAKPAAKATAKTPAKGTPAPVVETAAGASVETAETSA